MKKLKNKNMIRRAKQFQSIFIMLLYFPEEIFAFFHISISFCRLMESALWPENGSLGMYCSKMLPCLMQLPVLGTTRS